MTFGGQLDADPPGLMARAIARKFAGDWRDADHVRSWALRIVAELGVHPPA
jgi:hypothetical protein